MVKVCVAGGTFFVVQVVGAGKVCVAAAEGEGQEVCDEGGVLVAGRPAAFPDAADEALERPASASSSHAGACLWGLPRCSYGTSAGGDRAGGSFVGVCYLRGAWGVSDAESRGGGGDAGSFAFGDGRGAGGAAVDRGGSRAAIQTGGCGTGGLL
nr:uncharacterized protein LOC127339130 [Lolium perenne]